MQSIMAGMVWKPTSGKSISWLMRAAVDCMWSLLGRAHRTGPRIKLCPFGHHEVLVDLWGLLFSHRRERMECEGLALQLEDSNTG